MCEKKKIKMLFVGFGFWVIIFFKYGILWDNEEHETICIAIVCVLSMIHVKRSLIDNAIFIYGLRIRKTYSRIIFWFCYVADKQFFDIFTEPQCCKHKFDIYEWF